MTKLTHCPECNSENIKFFEKRNNYICSDCGCSFSEIEFKKLNIFLSYGHDSNEELVRIIRDDLKYRGHEVWFDKNEIKFGDDWRRSITDGILNSNRVLSFLSKYSTRDPGVCRDEIAIAIGVKGGNIQTILVESEQDVQPPVNIGHIQWLDMHEWQELRKSDNEKWESWYKAKLSEIIKVIESEESLRFAGEIEKLNGYLKPIKSDARISGLLNKGFYGREWLFEAVVNWRNDKNHDSRLFWIMGDPGVGKSAFAAQLTHKHSNMIIASQFCEWDKPDHKDAGRVICSIAFQLATRLPDYRKFLLTLLEIAEFEQKNPDELFDYLLSNPFKSVINGGRERFLIIIDALDEANESGRNPLVEMLAHNAQNLPSWLGIIVTSRPEFDVRTPFQGLNPFPLDTKSEFNRNDIRDYLVSKLSSQLKERTDIDTLINQILEKSEGVFLYVERFCDEIKNGNLTLNNPDQFPQGLGGIFAQYFNRQFPDLEQYKKSIRPALRAILAAREPLPVEILQKLFIWQDEELRDFIRPIASLFPTGKETGVETIKAYHKSLSDWLTDETKAGAFFVSEKEGHRMLADYSLARWQQERFALSEVVFFLVETCRYEDARVLILDREYRKLKQDKLGVESISADFLHAEKESNGYFGLTGPAWHLLKFAEKEFNAMIQKAAAEGGGAVMSRYLSHRHEMFEKACTLSVEWFAVGLSVRRCAKFCEEVLLLFADDLPLVVKAAALLHEQAEGCTHHKKFEAIREEVIQAMTTVANTPRIHSDYRSGMVDSAWQMLDYEEKALSATLAALHLRTLQTVRDIWTARRFKAIADCDTDPFSEIISASRDADMVLEEKLIRAVEWFLLLSQTSLKSEK